MSDANRVGLAYVEETTYGVVEPGNPDLQDLRYVSESIKQDTEVISSQEIRSDRQVPDVIRVGLGTSGEIRGELSYGAYDKFFYRGLQANADFAAPTTVISASVLVDAAAADDSFNISTAWTATPSVGSWIKVSGFTGATGTPNNGFWKVKTATTQKITVAGALTTKAAGDSVTIVFSAGITNGTTFKSFNIEKSYLDLSNTFEVALGQGINTIGMNAEIGGIVEVTFGFQGKKVQSGAATIGDGANTAAPTNDVMNTVDNVVYINESEAIYGSTGFNLSLNNNLRQRQQLGTLGAISVGSGTVQVEGGIQAYFATPDAIDRYLNFTASALAIVLKDGAGNAYIVDLPRVKYTDGQRVAGGINQDVIADLSFTAYRHPTEGITIRVVRFAGP